MTPDLNGELLQSCVPNGIMSSIWKQAFILFSGLYAAFLLTISGYDSSEATFHFAVSKQIVKNGALSFPNRLDGIYTVAPNGRTYASHEIGNTLFLIPLALAVAPISSALEPQVGPELTNRIIEFLRALVGPLYCSICIGFLFLMLRMIFGIRRKQAVLHCMAFAFCTYYWLYTRAAFDGVLCSALLAPAVFCLFRFARMRQTRLLIIAFILFGLAFITRLTMALPIAAAFLYLILEFHAMPRLLLRYFVIAGITLLPFICWQMFYNHLRTGNALLSPVQTVQYAANNALSGSLLAGITGYLFSPGKSVFVYAPVVALSALCVRHFYTRFRSEAIFVYTTFLLWLVIHSKLRSWEGAFGWGPRYFITILVLLALPYFVCADVPARRLSGRLFRTAALAWGFLLGLTSIAGDPQFRMMLAYHENRLAPQFVWSFWHSQSIDMIRGVIGNLIRMINGGPMVVLPGFSPGNLYANNTVNVWQSTLLFFGVGIAPIIVVSALLAITAGVCFYRLLFSYNNDTPG